MPHPQWNPAWSKAGLWDAVVVGVGSTAYMLESLIETGSHQADWSQPLLWDNDVREALRFRTPSYRATSGTVSDLMMAGSLIHNVLFDNLVVAWMVHREPELAWQMSVMNAEAYAIALSLTSVVKSLTSRARPMVEECEADPRYSSDCQALSRYRSFFSGHSAVTAVGAGLLCAHHLNVPLYDGGPLDVGACVMGIALTLATGGLRIASDNHWATDVTTGHIVGFASGYLVPVLLYYTGDDEEPDGDASQAGTSSAIVLPSISSDHVGLQVSGMLP